MGSGGSQYINFFVSRHMLSDPLKIRLDELIVRIYHKVLNIDRLSTQRRAYVTEKIKRKLDLDIVDSSTLTSIC